MNSDMTHELSDISKLCAAGQFSQALAKINDLIKNNNNHVVLYNQKSLIEKQLGLLDEAEQSLKEAVSINPNYAASYNNLGSIYYKQRKFELAEKTFEKALTVQTDYVDALYNLALAYKAQNKIEECAASLMSICKINPAYIPAHFLLAKTLIEKNEIVNACQRLVLLADLSKNAIDVLNEIIKLLLDHDRFLEAEPFCLKALEKQPDDYRLLYNLGVINERKRNIHKAIHFYLQAIDIKPDSFEALNNLGVLYLETQQTKAARFYLEKAVQLAPNNKPLQHTLAAISNNQSVNQASKEYITSLFDQYADTFEDHLLTSLEYKVPELLTEQIQHATPKANLKVLDVGCGTGLFGKIFKPYCSQLLGLDLSQKMLAKAKEKQIYDELICSDIVDYLKQCHNSFDLIAAADVFVYTGDLEAIFAAVQLSLTAQGLFSFSIETTEGENYLLAKSGRFHHSRHYIETLAHKYQFSIIDYQQVTTRMQHNQPAVGGLYLLMTNNH